MFNLPFFNRNKGAATSPVLSDEGGILTQNLGGKWFHLAKQGRVFHGSAAAAGVVLPIYSATAQVFGIWNPANSGVNGHLVKLRMTYVDTTGAAGGYCLGLLRDVGSVAGTAAPISAFTATVPERAMLGGQTGGNRIRFTGSACTVTTALMVAAYQLGMNQLVTTAADATTVPWSMQTDFDGDVVLEPGNALFLAGNIATLTKWVPTLTWAEIPA
jgi:hypothetical protein